MGNACLLLHPFRPLLVAVDYSGVVRVFSSRKPYTMKNAFYISTGKPPYRDAVIACLPVPLTEIHIRCSLRQWCLK